MKSKLIALFTIPVLFIISCKKESTGTNLKVKLTDAPAAYDEVNVDIQEVNIKMDEDSGWISLPTTSGIYNLLDYQNGVDTLIAQTVVTGSTVKEIRLVLGTENSIIVGGQSYPLTIPSGSESGLKIKMNKSLKEGVDYLSLDFDAALSVSEELSGYKLRPVIKILQ
jgi:uncharacterized protein DUF4382